MLPARGVDPTITRIADTSGNVPSPGRPTGPGWSMSVRMRRNRSVGAGR